MEVLIKSECYLLIPWKNSRITNVYQNIYIQPYDWNWHNWRHLKENHNVGKTASDK